MKINKRRMAAADQDLANLANDTALFPCTDDPPLQLYLNLC